MVKLAVICIGMKSDAMFAYANSRGNMQRENNRDLSTESWGTPNFTLDSL